MGSRKERGDIDVEKIAAAPPYSVAIHSGKSSTRLSQRVSNQWVHIVIPPSAWRPMSKATYTIRRVRFHHIFIPYHCSLSMTTTASNSGEFTWAALASLVAAATRMG